MDRDPLATLAVRLADAWVVTDGGRPLYGADPGRPGIVTPVLADRATAVSLAAIVADGDAAWAARTGVAPLGDPWAAMRAFAAHGVVGLSPQGRWVGGAPPRMRFVVRRGEVGAALPTVLAVGDDDTGWQAVAPPGTTAPDARDLVPWVRYDVTDLAAITFRDGMPLGCEASGAPLFEVQEAGQSIVVRDDPVAGPWGVAGGVVQLWSDASVAHDRCEARARASSVGSLEVAPVTDLAAHLARLSCELPGATVTINPHGHREHAAIAYLARPDVRVPRWWASRPRLAGPLVRGPGGIWTVGPGNRFDLIDEVPEWSGCDTFFWDGIDPGMAWPRGPGGRESA